MLWRWALRVVFEAAFSKGVRRRREHRRGLTDRADHRLARAGIVRRGGEVADASAMYGTRLFDQPKHALVKDRLQAFLARPGPLGLEIGFDHGMCILDRARTFPAVNHLGVELREARVVATSIHAPPNCLLLRVDARTLCSVLLPDASVDWLYLLFPTPTPEPKRALLGTGFAASVARVLKPGGVLWFASDMRKLADQASELFAWEAAPPPPLGLELSRRERVCRRDSRPVFRLCVRRPELLSTWVR